MILAAAHSNGVDIIGTYDTLQLEPICKSSGMSISRDEVDRKAVLERAFSTCFHVFARERDNIIEEQVEMDDGLLYILAAGHDNMEAQTRALKRFDRGCPTHSPDVLDFHLAYTRDCARFHAFRGLSRCIESGDWDPLGQKAAIGARYRDLGKSGKVLKNHAYTIVRSTGELIGVENAFDEGVTLEETALSQAEAETLFDPPWACTVHAVQGRTVEVRLVIHQARHRFSDLHWLCTAVSRATGPSNVRVVDDMHRSVCDMNGEERRGDRGLLGRYQLSLRRRDGRAIGTWGTGATQGGFDQAAPQLLPW